MKRTRATRPAIFVPAGPCPGHTVRPVWTDRRIVRGERVVSDRTGNGMAASGNGAADASIDRGSVPFRAEARARVDLDHVPGILDASDWLGEEIEPDDGPMRRLASDLVLSVGSDRPITFRKSVIVGIGQPSRDAGGWSVPIEWQAASLAPLFPVFVGQVRIDVERVAIEGNYAPPFGVIGAVLDRAMLGIAARTTAKVILERFVEALTRN